MAAKNNDVIEIRSLDIVKVPVHIVGTSPLIMHAWDEKAKRMMLEAQMGISKGKKKDVKNPVADFINSMYWIDGKPQDATMDAFYEAVNNGAKFGFPVTAFKQAAISGSYRMGWSKDKMSLRGAFFLEGTEGDMVVIKSDVPEMREDMVKIGMGTADIRYRGQFNNWETDLVISYNKNGQYSLEAILNIINAGGYVCGIGEWRPERDGQFGMFQVATD